MFYRVCLIINSVLSVLFIVLAFYVILIEGDTSTESLTIAASIVIPSIILICFNMVCFRVDKINKEQAPLSGRLKLTGKVFFVLILLIEVAIILATVSTVNSFLSLDDSGNKGQTISLLIPIFLYLVLCFTSIVSLVFFSKSLRKNKSLVSELINKIGTI